MKSNSESIGVDYNINKGNTENKILDEERDTSLFDQRIELAFANASLIIYFVFYFLPVTYIMLWSI
jgi:hypothetical protein